MLETRLTQMLGLRHPIISAPMVRQSGGALAAAVSKAGGLGSFGAVSPQTGSVTADYVVENIARVRAATDRPFGIGFNSPFIAENRENFDAALDAEVPVILLSFGDPRPWLGPIKARELTAICQVQTMEAARMAVGEGADALTVQGRQAGGHCGELSLMPFLAEAAEAFPDLPIAASGGIGDGRTLADVLSAGADAGWIGTAFRAVAECEEAAPEERAAILASDGRDTLRTPIYDIVTRGAAGGSSWPEGIEMRVRRSALTDRWSGREVELAESVAKEPQTFAHIWEDPAGPDYGHLFSEAAQFVTDVETAAVFMDRIAAEAERCLGRQS